MRKHTRSFTEGRYDLCFFLLPNLLTSSQWARTLCLEALFPTCMWFGLSASRPWFQRVGSPGLPPWALDRTESQESCLSLSRQSYSPTRQATMTYLWGSSNDPDRLKGTAAALVSGRRLPKRMAGPKSAPPLPRGYGSSVQASHCLCSPQHGTRRRKKSRSGVGPYVATLSPTQPPCGIAFCPLRIRH